VKLKHFDMFAGIGGFSLGLERTGGFETVGFCEIDRAAQKVLNKNFCLLMWRSNFFFF
jgi:DNA (cytosine-5)-methyltransferase 1